MLRSSAAVYVAQENRAVSAACSAQSVSKCYRRWAMQYTCKNSTHLLPGTEVPPLSSGKSGSGGGSLCTMCENSKLFWKRQSTCLKGGGSRAVFWDSCWATLCGHRENMVTRQACVLLSCPSAALAPALHARLPRAWCRPARPCRVLAGKGFGPKTEVCYCLCRRSMCS